VRSGAPGRLKKKPRHDSKGQKHVWVRVFDNIWERGSEKRRHDDLERLRNAVS
jgi:hypothetical protein